MRGDEWRRFFSCPHLLHPLALHLHFSAAASLLCSIASPPDLLHALSPMPSILFYNLIHFISFFFFLLIFLCLLSSLFFFSPSYSFSFIFLFSFTSFLLIFLYLLRLISPCSNHYRYHGRTLCDATTPACSKDTGNSSCTYV